MKSMDSRDYTKFPKVELDIDWALTMRKRLIEFGQTGKGDWYKAKIDRMKAQ